MQSYRREESVPIAKLFWIICETNTVSLPCLKPVLTLLQVYRDFLKIHHNQNEVWRNFLSVGSSFLLLFHWIMICKETEFYCVLCWEYFVEFNRKLCFDADISSNFCFDVYSWAVKTACLPNFRSLKRLCKSAIINLRSFQIFWTEISTYTGQSILSQPKCLKYLKQDKPVFLQK